MQACLLFFQNKQNFAKIFLMLGKPSSSKKKLLLISAVVLILFALSGTVIYFLSNNNKSSGNSSLSQKTATSSEKTSSSSQSNVSWSFDGSTWVSSGTPPACPPQPILTTPVDLSAVTSILYPGQKRSGQYKSHGGFRFDNKQDTAVTVKAPMNSVLVSGSRYLSQGQTQYLLFFFASCGIEYRLDHLRTLSPTLQSAADATLPAAKEGDSRTTFFNPPIPVKTGEVLATEIGFANPFNVFIDFGVSDLRTPNAQSQDPTYAAAYASEKQYTYYAICWIDWLPAADAATVKSLPGADQISGKTSDYCK